MNQAIDRDVRRKEKRNHRLNNDEAFDLQHLCLTILKKCAALSGRASRQLV